MIFTHGNWDHVPGLVKLRPGDMVRLAQSGLAQVESVNDCCARVRLLGTQTRQINARFKDDGQPVQFEVTKGTLNISSRVEPQMIIPDASIVSELAAESNTETQTKDDQMKSRTPKDKTKARGGLAAEAAELKRTRKPGRKARAAKEQKPKEPKAPGTRKPGPIFGFNVTPVLWRLGMEGVTRQQAKAIVDHFGITMSEKSLYVQVALGKAGTSMAPKGPRTPAPLTAEQVAELKAIAPEVPAEK